MLRDGTDLFNISNLFLDGKAIVMSVDSSSEGQRQRETSSAPDSSYELRHWNSVS